MCLFSLHCFVSPYPSPDCSFHEKDFPGQHEFTPRKDLRKQKSNKRTQCLTPDKKHRKTRTNKKNLNSNQTISKKNQTTQITARKSQPKPKQKPGKPPKTKQILPFQFFLLYFSFLRIQRGKNSSTTAFLFFHDSFLCTFSSVSSGAFFFFCVSHFSLTGAFVFWGFFYLVQNDKKTLHKNGKGKLK